MSSYDSLPVYAILTAYCVFLTFQQNRVHATQGVSHSVNVRMEGSTRNEHDTHDSGVLSRIYHYGKVSTTMTRKTSGRGRGRDVPSFTGNDNSMSNSSSTVLITTERYPNDGAPWTSDGLVGILKSNYTKVFQWNTSDYASQPYAHKQSNDQNESEINWTMLLGENRHSIVRHRQKRGYVGFHSFDSFPLIMIGVFVFMFLLSVCLCKFIGRATRRKQSEENDNQVIELEVRQKLATPSAPRQLFPQMYPGQPFSNVEACYVQPFEMTCSEEVEPFEAETSDRGTVIL